MLPNVSISQVHLPQANSSANKGIAFVKFKDESHADAARQALDGKSFCGRLIHVLQASKVPRVGGREGLASSALHEGGFKQRKQVELKDKADRPFNWSTLYMNVSYKHRLVNSTYISRVCTS